MAAETVLDRFEGVRPVGPGRWVALCSAHEDKRPSLALRLLDDGRWLVHCRAHCSVESVLSSAGLTFEDLYPPRDPGHCRPIRRPWSAAQLLHLLDREACIELVLVADQVNGRPATEWDRKRLIFARQRIATIIRELPRA